VRKVRTFASHKLSKIATLTKAHHYFSIQTCVVKIQQSLISLKTDFFHLIQEKAINWTYDFLGQKGYRLLVSVCLGFASRAYFSYPTEPGGLAGKRGKAEQLAKKKKKERKKTMCLP